MKSIIASIVWLVSATLLPLSGQAGQQRYPSEHKDSLLHAQDRLARSLEVAGPIDGFVPYLTSDAVYLYPGQEIITGRDATRSFLKTVYARPRAVKTLLHVVAGQASIDGTLGYTFGWLEEITSASGTAVTQYGRFIAMWRKRDDSWRVQAFLRLNSSQPLPEVPRDAMIVDGVSVVAKAGLPAANALEVATADARFADLSVDQGYTVAFTSYDMDESVIVTNADFYWNSAGVEFAWSGWVPAEQLAWHPLRAEAAGSGDLGWSIGHGTYTRSDTNPPFVSYSKYLTVWVRTVDGWRFLMDGGNARPAP
jgi:ketosteroid isomerase-like protein